MPKIISATKKEAEEQRARSKLVDFLKAVPTTEKSLSLSQSYPLGSSFNFRLGENERAISVSAFKPSIEVASEQALKYATTIAEKLEKKGLPEFYAQERLNNFYKHHSEVPRGQMLVKKTYVSS